MFRLRPDVARYTNTLAKKNSDNKQKKSKKPKKVDSSIKDEHEKIVTEDVEKLVRMILLSKFQYESNT